MTPEASRVKTAVERATGFAVDAAEAAAIARQLDDCRRAAAAYLTRLERDADPATFAQRLAVLAPEHG